MLARPLVHNAPFPAAYSSLRLTGAFDTPTSVGATYNDSVAIAGGSGNYDNARIIDGAIPNGTSLSVDGTNLLLQGDVEAPAGTFTFLAAVYDTTRLWTATISATIVVYEQLVLTGTYN